MFNINWSKSLILFIVPLLLYVVMLRYVPLLEPDEARYSNVSHLMNSSCDYVTPQLMHVVFLDKPPLTYWATAAAFRIFGESSFSARLFGGLCTWACILLVYAMGLFIKDEKTGLFAAGIYSTFIYVFLMGRMDIMDSPLTLFLSLAIWSGYRYFADNGYAKRWLYLFYIACALAFLTKGLMGFVFPPVIIALWLLVSGRWRDSFKMISPAGILVFLGISLPWIVLAQRANHDFLWYFFVREQFLRYTTTVHERVHSDLMYVPVLIVGSLPWLAPLITAFMAKKQSDGASIRKHAYSFLMGWILFVFVFFSFSSAKMITYIFSAFVPLAVIFGGYIRIYDDIPAGKMPVGTCVRFTPIIMQSLILMMVLLMPYYVEVLGKFVKIGPDLEILKDPKWALFIVMPVVLQVLMVFMPELVRAVAGKGWFITMYCLAAIFLASLVWPASALLTPSKTAVPIRQAIKRYVPEGQTLYEFGIHLFGLDFAQDEELMLPIVGQFAEMSLGVQKLPPDVRKKHFLTTTDFLMHCWQVYPVYGLTDKSQIVELRLWFPDLTVLWSNGHYFIVQLPKYIPYKPH